MKKTLLIFVLSLLGLSFMGCSLFYAGIEDPIVYRKVKFVFEENGGSEIKDAVYERSRYGDFPDYPTKSGKRFAGWYYDEAFLDSFAFHDFFNNRTDKQVTLYAKWGAVERFQTIFSQTNCTFGITDDNRILAWGSNEQGILGDGTTTSRYDYVDITSSFGFTEDEMVMGISSGSYATIAITTTGRVFSWGTNHGGILGRKDGVNQFSPTEITNHFNFESDEKPITIKINRNLAFLSTDKGRVFVWGSIPDYESNYGRFVNGLDLDMDSPQDVTLNITNSFEHGETIEAFYASSIEDIYLVLTSMNRIWLWGDGVVDWFLTPLESARKTPQNITMMIDLNQDELIDKVELGFGMVLFYTSVDRVLVIGKPNEDYVFLPEDRALLSPFDINTATFLRPDERIVSVQAGDIKIVIWTNQSRLLTWGYNSRSMLGIGNYSQEFITSPVDVIPLLKLANIETPNQVLFGINSTYIFTSSNRLFAVGSNFYNQYGVGGKLELGRPVQVYGMKE